MNKILRTTTRNTAVIQTKRSDTLNMWIVTEVSRGRVRPSQDWLFADRLDADQLHDHLIEVTD